MIKPTIFFSHSTKDKELLLKLKHKLDAATGGVLDIFMSSDGQSIPFGQNWVHKIEQGLDNAKIMFVFITPNSITSNWIYFEAGFAYSKNIEVIPVGVGVDIALLRPPLSLLQGFNIISNDSLNNFIAIINEKFSYSIHENFTEEEFEEIIINTSLNNKIIELSEIFDRIEYVIPEKYQGKNEETTRNNLELIFNSVIEFLKEQKYLFSYSESYGKYNKAILIRGIRILYSFNPHYSNKITISISPYDFKESIELLDKIMTFSYEQDEFVSLKFWLNSEYKYMENIEDISSVVSKYPSLFNYIKENVEIFKYGNINFIIFNHKRNNARETPEYVLLIQYDQSESLSDDILCLIYNLLDKNVIRKRIFI